LSGSPDPDKELKHRTHTHHMLASPDAMKGADLFSEDGVRALCAGACRIVVSLNIFLHELLYSRFSRVKVDDQKNLI
jgi:hypothetical protein